MSQAFDLVIMVWPQHAEGAQLEILGCESAVYFQLSFWREVQQLSLQSPFLGCSKLICAGWKVREELVPLP